MKWTQQINISIWKYDDLLIPSHDPGPYTEDSWAWAEQNRKSVCVYVQLNLISACSHLSQSCLTGVEEGLPGMWLHTVRLCGPNNNIIWGLFKNNVWRQKTKLQKTTSATNT